MKPTTGIACIATVLLGAGMTGACDPPPEPDEKLSSLAWVPLNFTTQPTTTLAQATTTTRVAEVVIMPTTVETTTSAPTTSIVTTSAAPVISTTSSAPAPTRAMTPSSVQAASMSATDFKAIIRDVWPDKHEAKAIRVAFCESSLREKIRSKSGDEGLFQINEKTWRKSLEAEGWVWADIVNDARTNAQVALKIWSDEGWAPWSCRNA